MADLGKRQATMDLALSLLPEGAVIVETGCARTPGNWSGDGLSTVVFGEWARDHGGHVYSVDDSHANVVTARGLCAGLPVTVSLDDSADYLRHWYGHIDLLYLDSMDYPYGPLCDLYGGKTDLGAAISQLQAMGDAEILARHGDLIRPSQLHCAKEFWTATEHRPTLVLIDDAGLPGGGKARVARLLLAEHGYRCLMDAYQTLWAKP